MKTARTLTMVLAALAAAAGCEEDVDLAQALADVSATSPDVCREICEAMVTCSGRYDETEGAAAQDAEAQTKKDCVISCALRANDGVYVYDDDTQTAEYDVKEHVSGGAWAAYMSCLWRNNLWQCDDDHGTMGIVADTEEACVKRDECVQLIDINLEYAWNVDNTACYPDGDERLWPPGTDWF